MNLCGRVQTFVFDKTGTLTEDGLQTLGMHAVEDEKPAFTKIEEQTSDLPNGEKVALLT